MWEKIRALILELLGVEPDSGISRADLEAETARADAAEAEAAAAKKRADAADGLVAQLVGELEGTASKCLAHEKKIMLVRGIVGPPDRIGS